MNRRLLLAAATAISLAAGRALAVCVPSASQVCYSGGVAVNIGPTTGNLIPWVNGLHIFSPTTGQSNLVLEHNSAAGSSVLFETNTGTRSCASWDSGSCGLDFQIQDNGAGILNFLANTTLLFQLSYTAPTFTFRSPVVFGSGSSFQVPTANPCTGVTPVVGLVCYDTGLHIFYYAAAPGPTWTPLLTAATVPDATSSVAGGLLASNCAAGSLVTGLGSGTGALSCGLPTVATTEATTDRTTEIATDSFSAGVLAPLVNPPKTANNWGDSIYPPESAKCTLTASGQIADYPIFIGDTTDQITQFAIDMSTGAGSGGSLEIGLRADSGTSTPGTLLVDGGAVPDTAGGVDTEASAFSTLTLHRGLYWIEVETVALGASNGVVWSVTATKPSFATSQVLQPGTAAGVLNGSISYAMVSSSTSTTGTLSAGAPGTFSLSASLCMPKVAWKIMSATP